MQLSGRKLRRLDLNLPPLDMPIMRRPRCHTAPLLPCLFSGQLTSRLLSLLRMEICMQEFNADT